MTYLRPHNRPLAGKARLLAGLIAAILLIVLVVSWRAPHAFSGLTTAIARPFWRMTFAVQTGALRSPEEVLRENAELKVELESLKQNIASSSIGAILSENVELRSILHSASSTPYKLAAVLARPSFMPYDELIIDLGAGEGVSTTTKVYAPGNILIGRVREVLGQTSKVALFSSSGEKYNVLIGAEHIPAAALGIGGGQYRTEVPHGTALAIGDSVSDSSLSNGPIGAIVSIVTDPANPFDTILFAPGVNVYQLRFVLVDTRPEGKSKK